MPTPDPALDQAAPTPADRRWMLALAVLLPALAVLWLGNDASWDTRNYHLYGPHAWLHGRHAIDIAPAQMQGFHNPLLDLPMYLLASHGAPAKLIGLWLALPAMFAIWCLLRLQQRLAPAAPTPGARIFLAVLALTGAATWSTLGLAMDDAFVAAGILGALVLLLDAPTPDAKRCLAAGAIAGATAGLKLSGAFYCPALALALLFLPGSARERAQRLLLLAIGGVAGFALAYGWWGWHLWQQHANPFFPYFNNVFASPELAARSFVDTRFLPQGPVDILLAPLRLLWRSQRFSEAGLKDPRLLLALLGFAWLAWQARRERASPLRALLVFVFAGFLGWALQSGIYRYAIALELLGALALALVLARVPKWPAAAMLLALLLVSVDTRRPDWNRVRSQAAPIPRMSAPLPADAMVVTATDAPLGYLALGLPDDVAMLGLHNNLVQPGDRHPLAQRAADRVAQHRGPIYLAGRADPGALHMLREQHGLEPEGACLLIESTIGDEPLCPLARVAAPE